MNRKSIRNLLLRVLLFPVFMGFAVPASGSETEEEAALPETAVSDLARPEDISAEEWEGLTEQEREALSVSAEQLADEEATATGNVDPDDLDALLEEEAGTSGEDGTEGTTTEEVTTTVPGDFPTDEDLLAFRPVVAASELKIPKVEAPAEFTEKLSALDAKEDELEELFENGKDGVFPTKTEYRQQMREINRERDSIKQQAQDAVFDLKQVAIDTARNEAESFKVQEKFFASRPYYGEMVDGETTMKADALFGALDKALQKVTKSDPSAPFMQRLLKADKAVKDAFGIKDGAKPVEKEVVKPKPAMPAATLPKTKTLAHVPAAAEHESDPYAHLNKLSADKLYEKLESMTDGQRNAYYKSIGASS